MTEALPATYYKYRLYSSQHLETLKSSKIYFASTKTLNDPFDCNLNLIAALKSAIKITASRKDSLSGKKLTELLTAHPDFIQKIESDIASAGIFSSARKNNCTLMWTHYANNHKGFCIGYNFSGRFNAHSMPDKIVGSAPIFYEKSNPFVKFFSDFFKRTSKNSYSDFWEESIMIGLTTKASTWKYEREIRIIRKESGTVQIQPSNIKEIIFGLNSDPSDEIKLTNILSGPQYQHVIYKRVARKGCSYNFKIV